MRTFAIFRVASAIVIEFALLFPTAATALNLGGVNVGGGLNIGGGGISAGADFQLAGFPLELAQRSAAQELPPVLELQRAARRPAPMSRSAGPASAPVDVASGTPGTPGTPTPGVPGTPGVVTPVNLPVAGTTSPTVAGLPLYLIGMLVISSDGKAIGYIKSVKQDASGGLLLGVRLMDTLGAPVDRVAIHFDKTPKGKDVIRLGQSLNRFLTAL